MHTSVGTGRGTLRGMISSLRLDLANELVARAMAENDGCADTHSVAASVLDARGDWSAALEANLSPSLPGQDVQDRHAAKCLAQIASALVVLGQLDLAHTVAELALHTDNECADSHNAMADVQQELGNWDVALNHRSKSAKRDHVERET
jgi:lipopolysaccharide biosynthesis regulator YciM